MNKTLRHLTPPPGIILLLCLLVSLAIQARAQAAPPIPESDNRYKADILVIVGHPDDDIEVAAYLAKAIEQLHKQVAFVYTTRGTRAKSSQGGSRRRNHYEDRRLAHAE